MEKRVKCTVYGQKTTGQKTTNNANPGHKTTRTKDHQAGFSLEKS